MKGVTDGRAATSPVASTPVPRATLVTSTACHLCEDAQLELGRRAERGELTLQIVPAESEEGRRLIAAHRPSMFPLVLLDGRPLGHGRLSRRRLDAALRSRTVC